MTDVLEQDLRGALADRAALMSPAASSRLRTLDYRPRSRSLPSRPALGALGLATVAAAGTAAVLLGSSAAPAFAGWTANPTAPRLGQLAAAERGCGKSAGRPILTDTRGPYTASIYADGSTCVQGDGITVSSSREGAGTSSIPPGTIQLNGAGESDSNGHALTMVDGPVGAGVKSVTITRGGATAVRATVKNGWYLAWWPGTEHPLTAAVRSASATSTQSFPTAPDRPGPRCPAGAHCASGYGFGAAPARGAGRSTTRIAGKSAPGQ